MDDTLRTTLTLGVLAGAILLGLGLMWLWRRHLRRRGIGSQRASDDVFILGQYSPILSWISRASKGQIERPSLLRTPRLVTSPSQSPEPRPEPDTSTLSLLGDSNSQTLPPAGWLDRPLPALQLGPLLGVRPGVVLIAGGLGLAAANELARGALSDDQVAQPWAFGVALIGLACLGLGWYLVSRGGWPRALRRLGAWSGLQDGQMAAMLMAPFFALTAGLLASGDWFDSRLPALAEISWLAAIGLIVFGGWRPAAQQAPQVRPRWGTVLCLGILVAAAFLARGLATGAIPVTLTGDEGSSGLSALDFVVGRTNNLFSIGWHGFPAFYYFIQSLSIRVFGSSIGALRLPSALAGALTVGALYLMGRSLFGQRAGLAAAILLGALHYHIHFSRIGLNNIWDGLAYVVTLGALWHAWRTEQRSAFLLAGLGLGLSQHFYPSARLLLGLIPVWLVLAGLLDRPRFKRLIPDLILMGLAALVVVLPLALFYLRHLDEFWGPIGAQSMLPSLVEQARATGEPLAWLFAKQIGLGLQAFTFTPIIFWYRPDVPILRLLPAAFFWVGVGALLLRPRDLRLWLLALWLLAFGVVGGMSESTPAAQRYVAAAPVAALLAGYGLAAAVSFALRAMPRQAWLAAPLTLALAGALALDDLRFYYLEYTPESHFRGRYDFEGIGAAVAEYLYKYLPGQTDQWQVLFFGYPVMGYYSIPSLQYLAPQFRGIDMNRPWGDAGNPAPTSDHLIFVFMPQHEADLQAVLAQYPGGLLIKEPDAAGEPLLDVYQYPWPDEAEALQQKATGIRAALPFQPPAGLYGWLAAAALGLVAATAYSVWRYRWTAADPETLAAGASDAAPPQSVDTQAAVASAPDPPPEAVSEAPRVEEPSAPPIPQSVPVALDPIPEPVAETASGLLPPAVTVLPSLSQNVRVTLEVPVGTTVQVTVEARPSTDGQAPVASVDVKPAGSRSTAQPWRSAPGTGSWPGLEVGQWRGRVQALFRTRVESWEAGLFALALMIYVASRLIGLEDFPIYFHGDEAIQGLQAADLVRNYFTYANEFLPTYFQNGPFWNLSFSVYVQVIPYLLFGLSEFAARATSALISVLGVAAVALILKQVFKVPHWWAGVFLLSLAPAWFLHSRTAFETVEMAALYAVFLYAYMRYRDGRLRYLYLALVAGALAFYAYSPGQVVVVVTGALLLLIDWRYHWTHRSTALQGLVVLALLVLPYLRFQMNHPGVAYYQLRERGSSLFDPNVPVGERLGRLTSQYLTGLSPAFWYLPYPPELDRHTLKNAGNLPLATLPLAALGLVILVRRIREPAYRVLLCALLAAPAGGALAEVGITRVLVFVVPASVLAAIGLSAALVWLERFRLPRPALAASLFVVLAGANTYLLVDALTNGPRWFTDYGLYGMQFGARQVFGQLVPQYLRQDPNLRVNVSPSWANGTDYLLRFFVPDELRPRVLGQGIDYFLKQRQPELDQNLLMVLPDYEYARAVDSPVLSDFRVDYVLPYPDGRPGFYFFHMAYSAQADAIFQAEAQARTQPVEDTAQIDGQSVAVLHSRFDGGQLKDLFDSDPFTLARGQEANPLMLDFHFSEPRPVTGVTLTTGSMDSFTVSAHLYGPGDRPLAEYTEQYLNRPADPTVTLAFGGAPPEVARLVIEIKNDLAGVTANIHVREIVLEK